MTYLVFANEESVDWHVEAGWLSELILSDWPDAEIQEPAPVDAESDGRGFHWMCVIGGSEVEAWLDKEGECLYVDGEFDEVAILVAWFREKMSREVEFALCDDTYSFHVVIENGASPRDIIESIPD
ncbi:hypothetical protein [Streptomyces umbrinus]|uniref:hypothetical protein n=1 Tax=Streptomyces umbrinus TaxID=67370 RepID=UPI0033E681EA